MGALPKRKISKSRKNLRRSHYALVAPATGKCPKCGKEKRSHFKCAYCGYYGDFKKADKKVADEAKKEEKKTVEKESKKKSSAKA